ncbi:hypothetical protein PIS_115 [Saccharomonospora phage PIS 136]|nr:hypothetical protein PIS_115 [Saccharomonospora phage PIS 136]
MAGRSVSCKCVDAGHQAGGNCLLRDKRGSTTSRRDAHPVTGDREGNGMTKTMTCPDCNGTGWDDRKDDQCNMCGGVGKIPT